MVFMRRDNVDLAAALYNSTCLGGMAMVGKYKKAVEKIYSKCDSYRDIFFEVIDLCGNPDSSRKLYYIGEAYARCGAKYRREALYYLKKYVEGNEWGGYDIESTSCFADKIIDGLTHHQYFIYGYVGHLYEGEKELDLAIHYYKKSLSSASILRFISG